MISRMEQCPYSPGKPVAAYMFEEHEELHDLILGVIAATEKESRAKKADPGDAKLRLKQFTIDLEQHLLSEERDIFPAAAKLGAERMIPGWLKDHEELRRLSTELEARHPRPCLLALGRMKDLLAAHTLSEEAFDWNLVTIPKAVRMEGMRTSELAWLSLADIEPARSHMAAEDVSEVARGPGGFLAAWKRAEGDPNRLGTHKQSGQPWRSRRNAFLARHLAQVEHNGEDLWESGHPTRRHLALVAWAYTPDLTRWRRWLGSASRVERMPAATGRVEAFREWLQGPEAPPNAPRVLQALGALGADADALLTGVAHEDTESPPGGPMSADSEQSTERSVTTERVGRRTYMRGNTYPIKDALRNAGAHWDPEQKAWWIGSDAKAQELAQLSPAAAATAPAAASAPSAPLTGVVLITGNTFMVREDLKALGGRWIPEKKSWEVPAKNAAAARALVDHGSRSVPSAAPQKVTPPQGYPKYRRYECEECGEYVTPGSSCWETGMRH